MIRKNYIPTININPILKNNFNSKATLKIAREIEKACVEVGFFQIVGHGVNLKKINKVCKIGENFFKSNKNIKFKLAPKKRNKKNKNNYRANFPNDVNGKEGLDIGDPLLSDDMKDLLAKEKFEVNHDMSYLNPEWQMVIDDYYNSIFDLGMKLFKSIISVYSSNIDLADMAFVFYQIMKTEHIYLDLLSNHKVTLPVLLMTGLNFDTTLHYL